jgi:hypothetical protein
MGTNKYIEKNPEMNRTFKDILPVGIAILAVFILVIGYAILSSSFKLSASEVLRKGTSGTSFLTENALDTFVEGRLVLVNLGKNDSVYGIHPVHSVHIPMAELLSDKNRDLFSTNQSKVLFSSDITQAAQAWILLTQLGYTNLYLLDTDTVSSGQTKNQAGETRPGNETLKYRFIPDTAIVQE